MLAGRDDLRNGRLPPYRRRCRERKLRKVHTAESIIDIAHLRNVLEQAGIACYVKNERLGGAVGEIPFVECWPELWVLRNGDALRARYAAQIKSVDTALHARARDIAALAVDVFERGGGQDAGLAAPLYVRDKVALKASER